MGLLDHVALSIIRGVGKTTGDLFSAEADPVVLDLWSDASTFSLIEWSPNIPSLKGNGLWADSPISDGRTLISGVNTNVTETMVVNLTGSTAPDFAAQFKKLQLMVQDARDFWDEFGQIEPVYIRWWASGAPGPQFALIYNIDMDVEFQDGALSQARITLTIEREYGWRGVRPGGNPKEWTAYKRGNIFNATYADLTAAGVHLASDSSVMNGNEYQTRETFLSENTLTIPAASIDGDLPALTFISIVAGSGTLGIMLSRDTKPKTMPSSNTGSLQIRKLDLIAAAATLGTNAAFVNDIFTLAYVPVSATRRRIDVSFGTATDAIRATWSVEADITTLRGRYALFARVRQYAGAANDLRYYVRLSTNNSDTFWTSPTMTPTLLGTIAAGQFALDYLGVVELPFKGRSVSQVKGRGLLVSGSGDSPTTDNFLFARLNASRVAGVAAILAISDLIFIPIDEAACKIIVTSTSDIIPTFLDNTGYLSHGGLETIADVRRIGLGTTDTMIQAELQGNGIMLQPKVDNRLIVLTDEGVGGSYPNTNAGLYVDLVPRWSAIRDA